MPDFVVRNRETGKFLQRGGDYGTPLDKWKAETVDKARIYRTRGAVTNSVGRTQVVEPIWKIREKCIRCGTPIDAKTGKFCPKCGKSNDYQTNKQPERAVPYEIEVLELEITLKPCT